MPDPEPKLSKAQGIALIEQMEDEFVGVWKFRTLDEGPGRRRWCASVLVAGRLIDTEDHPTINEAIQDALYIVQQLKGATP